MVYSAGICFDFFLTLSSTSYSVRFTNSKFLITNDIKIASVMDATLLQYVEFDLFAKLQIKNTLFCHIFVCALHIERVEHLRAGGFTQNVRREIVFDNHFAERFKFRSVDIVGKG